MLPSGMGTSSMKWQPSMIMRATQKKRMSKPVTRSCGGIEGGEVRREFGCVPSASRRR